MDQRNSKIKGIERFAVPEDHPAYNQNVGLLFDTNVKKEDLENLLKEYECVIVKIKNTIQE